MFALAIPTIYLKLRILFVKRKRNRDKLVLVVAVAVVVKYYNAYIANTHLSLSTLSNSVDAKQTVVPI
jgi:hypothetical protein